MESSPRVRRRGGQDGTAEPHIASPAAPTALIDEIAALWGEFLSGEVGPDDDFFALGGNSLIGIQIIDRVARDYGVALSVRAFYLAQTPARVAELIDRERTGP